MKEYPQDKTVMAVHESFPLQSEVLYKKKERNVAGFRAAVVTTATGAVILAIYLLRLDPVVGQFKDDGWYVVLAKSLSTGHGYNLINLPQHSGLYFYPPFFPSLLSLLYRVWPEFPANVILLKALSIASMLLLSALVFRLFKRENRLPCSLAYLVAVSTALAPSFVLLATSAVMSEAAFTTLQFAALMTAESASRKPRHSSMALLAAGLASAAYLTRTMGIAVVAAIALFFLIRKMFKPLALFMAVVTLSVGSWMLYQHVRMSTGSGAPMAVEGYSGQFWDRYAGTPGSKVTIRALPGRIWQVCTVMVGDDIGALIMPSLYRSGAESGEEVVTMTAVIPAVSNNPMRTLGSTMGLAVTGQLISLGFSIVVLIGFSMSAKREIGPMELLFVFSLAILAVWPSSPMRYLVPLLPLILYYLAVGVAAVQKLIQRRVGESQKRDGWSAARILIACVLVFLLYDNALYIGAKQKSVNSFEHPDWLRQFAAVQQTASWIRNHTSEHEVISSDNLPMLYLYTNRETEMCAVWECANKGIRYYVNTENVTVPGGTTVAFRTNYLGVEVDELRGRMN